MKFEEFIRVIEIDRPMARNWPLNPRLFLHQNSALRLIQENKYNIIYKNRREGISTALNLYMFWMALSNPGISIALIAPNSGERESFRQMLNMNFTKFRIYPDHTRHNQNFTEFDNKSRIYYLNQSPNSLIGIRIDLAVLQEFSYFKQKEEILSNIIHTLKPGNSKLIITSEDTTIKEKYFKTFPINEIYGYAFSGKRNVLTEKTFRGKLS